MNFTSHGYNYLKDEYGVHQLNADSFTYDENYCATYNTESYRRGNEILQALRLGFVIGCHGSIPSSLADIGFGNGAFLMRCKDVIPKLYGKDVSGIQLDFVENVWHYPKCDVVTFWDCLEHIQDLSFLYDIPCETICISLPWCHFDSIEWFDKFHHHKPNEHLHYFNKEQLIATMNKYGWKCISYGNQEDIVRIGKEQRENILTCGFKRK